MSWQSGLMGNVARSKDRMQPEKTMGVKLANMKTGTGPEFSWRTWSFLLITAGDYGWAPQGTVLEFEFHFDSFARRYRLNDVTRRKYENDLRKFCSMWPGGYDSNHFQLVTEEDSKGMLKSLIRALNNRHFQEAAGKGEMESIRVFMTFLKDGAFRIGQ